MPHYTERDIKEASSVNLIEFARSQGFDMKREDNKAFRIKGNGGLFVFEGGFYHHSEQKKGNSIHFCKDYLDMKFQEAVQTLLDFKGVMREEEYAPRTAYNSQNQNYGRPPIQNQRPQQKYFHQNEPQDYDRQQTQPFQPQQNAQGQQFQVSPQDFGRHQEQMQRQSPEFYGEPPPIDEYYNDLPPEYWGEPPPEANNFYGEPVDYQWGNEYQLSFQEQPFQEQPFFQEQNFPENPMVEPNFQGNQTQFQSAPPIESSPHRPSQDVSPPKPTQDSQIHENYNLEYELPHSYEHDLFEPIMENLLEEQREKKEKLVLPPKSSDKNGSSAFHYLTETRCCDKDIVNKLMNEGDIFEAQTEAKGFKFKNVAFVGRDNKNKPKYCSLRSIGKSVFKKDVTNSDKHYGFTMKAKNEKSDRVFVCESAIDVISHATLTKMNNRDPYEDSRISMGGLFDKALDTFLAGNPQIKSIVFAFDNDTTGKDSKGNPHNHGQEFAKKCCEKYSKLGYKVQIQTPQGKDFNEVLQAKAKPSVKKQLAYVSQQAKEQVKPILPTKKTTAR